MNCSLWNVSKRLWVHLMLICGCIFLSGTLFKNVGSVWIIYIEERHPARPVSHEYHTRNTSFALVRAGSLTRRNVEHLSYTLWHLRTYLDMQIGQSVLVSFRRYRCSQVVIKVLVYIGGRQTPVHNLAGIIRHGQTQCLRWHPSLRQVTASYSENVLENRRNSSSSFTNFNVYYNAGDSFSRTFKIITISLDSLFGVQLLYHWMNEADKIKEYKFCDVRRQG